MTETAEPAGRAKPAPRPIEVELKYRVLDLPAAERYLSAATIGPFTGASQARSTQMEDRYVDTADRRDGTGRASPSACAAPGAGSSCR